MDTKLSSLIVLVTLLTLSTITNGAIPVRQAGSEKQNHYIESGVFVGGHDHGFLSLLNVRHNLKNEMERLVFDVGQKTTTDAMERPGFFHIALQKQPNRIVLDLENVIYSKVTAEQILGLLKKSPYVTHVNLYQDSIHKNLTLEILLKKAVQMEVFELVTPGKPGRIVMDIKG
jgi:hypothetical protein